MQSALKSGSCSVKKATSTSAQALVVEMPTPAIVPAKWRTALLSDLPPM
jgi:hypothetical protein